jgi:hypothetical protein
MLRRTLVVCVALGTLVCLQVPARATSVTDRNDPLPRLDIRSASVVQVSPNKLRVRLVFWDRTPFWLLKQRAARIEMSDRAPGHHPRAMFGFRFWPDRHAHLRISYGEPGSACCGHARARHPDPFRYVALVRFSMHGALVKSFRAARTTQLPRCQRPRCGLVGGTLVDKTRWVSTT